MFSSYSVEHTLDQNSEKSSINEHWNHINTHTQKGQKAIEIFIHKQFHLKNIRKKPFSGHIFLKIIFCLWTIFSRFNLVCSVRLSSAFLVASFSVVIVLLCRKCLRRRKSNKCRTNYCRTTYCIRMYRWRNLDSTGYLIANWVK